MLWLLPWSANSNDDDDDDDDELELEGGRLKVARDVATAPEEEEESLKMCCCGLLLFPPAESVEAGEGYALLLATTLSGTVTP